MRRDGPGVSRPNLRGWRRNNEINGETFQIVFFYWFIQSIQIQQRWWNRNRQIRTDGIQVPSKYLRAKLIKILFEDNENKKPRCYIRTCASYKTCVKSHENPQKVPNSSPHKLYQLFSAFLDPRLRFQQLSCSSPSSQLGDGVRGSNGGEHDEQLVEQEHE